MIHVGRRFNTPKLNKFGLICASGDPDEGPTGSFLPVWAVNEISKQLPLPTSGRRHVLLEGPDTTVRPALSYQPEIPVAGPDECGQDRRTVRIQRSSQCDGPPGVIRPELEPTLAVAAVDADTRHPRADPRAAAKIRDPRQVLLDDTARPARSLNVAAGATT